MVSPFLFKDNTGHCLVNELGIVVLTESDESAGGSKGRDLAKI